MAYWLMKSEPSCYSWDDLLRDGRTPWDGVRNHQAANYMKAMVLGDRAFFYHSVTQKAIVGIMEVVGEYYPDPSDASGRFGMVDMVPRLTVPDPVSLKQIKSDGRFDDLALIRQSRLSVLPVTAPHWQALCGLAGVPPTED